MKMSDSLSLGEVVAADGGRVLRLEGTPSVVKIHGYEVEGQYSVIEHTLMPGVLVPPHVHEGYEHLTLVLRGEVGFRVATSDGTARQGDYVLMPRGVPHALWNGTEEPVTYAHVTTPGGFEGYFIEMAEMFKGDRPDPERLRALAARYTSRYVPEQVAEIEARYGVRAAT